MFNTSFFNKYKFIKDLSTKMSFLDVGVIENIEILVSKNSFYSLSEILSSGHMKTLSV